MPKTTPGYKIRKLKRLGAKVIICGHSWDGADHEARKFSFQTGSVYVHAFEDPKILRGHSTAAVEIVRQLPNLDIFVCSIGGGGIISSISDTLKSYNGAIECYGVETYGAHSVFKSLLAGKPIRMNKLTSLAQSIAVQAPTEMTYRLITRNVHGIAVVSDHDAQRQQKTVYKAYRELLELASSCSIAAVSKSIIPGIKGKNVVILACGGNLEKKTLNLNTPQQRVEAPYYHIC